MAVIKETLLLADRFSASFKNFINLGEKAAASAQKAQRSTNALTGSVGRLVTAVGGLTAGKGITNLSDSLVQTQARLDNVNDGMQTTKELNNMIFASAQRSRGSYLGTAQAVSQLASQAKDAFKSTKEAVYFSELLNKSFALSGTSEQGKQAAMLQLTQAMASGVLRGEELNSIFENAQPIIQRIADYMGVPIGKIRDLASEGKITADIIKNSMFAAADDINQKFDKMPMTFGQAMQKMKNIGVREFAPMSTMISQAINSPRFQTAMNAVASGIYMVVSIATGALSLMGATASFMIDNWSWLSPIIFGVAAALAIYNINAGVAAAKTIAHAIASGIACAQLMLQAAATFTAMAAQQGLNAALAACPISWVVAGFILIVAAVIAGIAAFNHFAQTGNTVLGTIVGAAFGAGAVLLNILKGIANAGIGAAEWLVNAFNTAVYNVQMFFYNMSVMVLNGFSSVANGANDAATAIANAFIAGANKAISGINWIIDALNKIPGINIGKIGTIGQVSNVLGGKKDFAAGLKAPTKPAAVSFGRFETESIGSAWSSGFQKGSAIGNDATNAITSKLDGIKNGFNDLASLQTDNNALLKGAVPSYNGVSGGGTGGGRGGKGNVGTVDRVKSIDGEVSLSDEDMKIYRDLAERRYMNRIELKTLAPNITVSIPESAAGTLSSQDVADKLKAILIEQMGSHTVVAHG